MCGIAGMLLRNQPAPVALLQKMGELQTHRGPDHMATEVRGTAGFVHTRLSIIDLSNAGNQPFCDTRYVLCFNGEIYNYLALKEQLRIEGVTFYSSSDTEVLFQALIRWGIEATLKVLRGMFAFSFYDSETDELHLGRDRFGIKPLNWIECPDGIYWASESKTLAVTQGLAPDPIRTLFSVAGTAEKSGWNTLFAEVVQVPPGCYLSARSGTKAQLHRYFDPIELVDPGYHRELDSLPGEQILAEFSRLFDQSIQMMLMSDVPMGVFASGGLDSNLISAYARRHQKDIRLFTANILGPYTEYPSAKLLAESLDAPLLDYKFSPEMLVRDWTTATWYYECPIVTFANAVPFANVAQLARKAGVKPVLTGEGSDELFLGYPDLLYNNYMKYLKFPVELVKQIYRLVPGLKRKLYPERCETIQDFAFNLSRDLDTREARQRGREAFSFLPEKQARYQAMTLELLHNPLVGLLYRNDRMGMLASIESRFPYLDEELVKFAVNLPWRWKLKKTWQFNDIRHPFIIDKYVVRKTGAKELPQPLANKNKWYFKVHSFNDIRAGAGLFHNGYLSNQLALTQRSLTRLVEKENPAFVARLASAEIFGRLYGLGQNCAEVDRHVQHHVNLNVHSTQKYNIS